MTVELSNRYYYSTGRRKEAVARVRLYEGTGKIIINDKPVEEYFGKAHDRFRAVEPLQVVGLKEGFDVVVKVNGGGTTGQSGAIRHGIARALLELDPDHRPVLRSGGFLTRDPRAKERKKPGLKRARKAPQYTKR